MGSGTSQLEGPEPDFGEFPTEKQSSLYNSSLVTRKSRALRSHPSFPTTDSLPLLIFSTRRTCPEPSTSLHDVVEKVQIRALIGGGVTKLALARRNRWPIPALLHPGPAFLLHLKRPFCLQAHPGHANNHIIFTSSCAANSISYLWQDQTAHNGVGPVP